MGLWLCGAIFPAVTAGVGLGLGFGEQGGVRMGTTGGEDWGFSCFTLSAVIKISTIMQDN